MRLRRVLTLAGIGGVLLASALFPAPAASAEPLPEPAIVPAETPAGSPTEAVPEAAIVPAEMQRTIFTVSGTAQKDSYIRPVPNQPVNYLSPANYRDGKAYLRVVVSGKPSTKPLWLHICMWRHRSSAGGQLIKFYWETCSNGTLATITTNKTYYFDINSFGSWWKKNGSWDYTQQASDIRPLLKDPVTGKLMYTRNCATTCYERPDIDNHLPFSMSIDFIMVRQGSTLKPPATWKGCPKTWSSSC